MREGRGFAYALRPLRVVFDDGALGRLGEEIDATLSASRVLLVSTPGRTSAVQKARAALRERVVAGFDDVRAHVPASVLAEAMGVVRASRPDCVVAIGGGSAIGLGKAVVREADLPLVAIPTTYSGSEMTDIWGVTTDSRKETGRDPRVAPRLVLYDPLLTHSLPVHVTAASGMNAIAHAVEALYSARGGPVASLLAAEGIRQLATSLPLLVLDPVDPPARRAALLGAHLCGRALDLALMGLHHKLCHVLGGARDLPHALTHAILLPHVVAYNASAAPDAIATVASSLSVQDPARGLWELNRKLGLTQTLADLGMGPGDVDSIVGQVATGSYPNPAPVTESGVRSLLSRAMAGEPPV